MNRGLIVRSVRETWGTTLGFAVGLFGAEMLLGNILPRFGEQFSMMAAQLEFIQTLLKMLVGAEAAGQLGPELLYALAWVHPVVLTLVWAHTIMFCTRVPAGEVERGTIDVLLGLPISRGELLRSETLVWAASGGVLMLAALLGNLAGGAGGDAAGAPGIGRIVLCVVNLFALYLAVGALAWLASALSNRRGRAISAAFAIVVGSFLLQFLAQYSALADRLSFLGLMDYYKPFAILTDGAWPWRDLAVLSGVAIAAWIAAAAALVRRDLVSM